MSFDCDDWKCPKCGTENYVEDQVEMVAAKTPLEELEDYGIGVPLKCENCGYKEIGVFRFDLEFWKAEIDEVATESKRKLRSERAKDN